MASRKPAGQDTRAARLITVRDQLAAAITECDSKRDLAALSREYRAVLTELDALQPVQKEVTRGVDEIGRRRAARRAGTENQSDTGSAGG